MDTTQAAPEPRAAPRGKRKLLFLGLAVAYGLMAGSAFGTMPGDLKPLLDAVQAAGVQAPPLLLIAAHFVAYFQQAWWALGLGFGGTGFVGLTGLLDRLLKPLLALVFLLGVATVGLAATVHFAGDMIRREIEGKAREKGVEILEKGLKDRLGK